MWWDTRNYGGIATIVWKNCSPGLKSVQRNVGPQPSFSWIRLPKPFFGDLTVAEAIIHIAFWCQSVSSHLDAARSAPKFVVFKDADTVESYAWDLRGASGMSNACCWNPSCHSLEQWNSACRSDQKNMVSMIILPCVAWCPRKPSDWDLRLWVDLHKRLWRNSWT